MAVRLPGSFNRGFAPGARAAARRPPLPTSIGMRTTMRGGPSRNYAPSKPVKPATPRPAAPKPAAPGAPAALAPLYRPAPPDPQLQGDISNLASQRDIDLARNRGSRTAGLAEYGFTEGAYDPSGTAYGALAVDPNNPFGKAAELKRTYDAERAGRGGSMAARGNLYAGSYQKSQDVTNFNQLGAEDTLQKALTSFLGQNTADWRQTGQDYQTAVGRAEGESMARIKDNPLYEPTIAGDRAPGAPKATKAVVTTKPRTVSKPAVKAAAKGIAAGGLKFGAPPPKKKR